MAKLQLISHEGEVRIPACSAPLHHRHLLPIPGNLLRHPFQKTIPYGYYPLALPFQLKGWFEFAAHFYITKQLQFCTQSWNCTLRTVISQAGVREGNCVTQYSLFTMAQDHPSAPGRNELFL